METVPISNFLSFRRQRVFLDGRVSAWSAISSGVPQGSVLGPILFCMTTDSLSHVCKNSVIIRYADDVSILHFVRSASEDHLQTEWENIVTWSENVNLPLNLLKCRVIDCHLEELVSASCLPSWWYFAQQCFFDDFSWGHFYKRHEMELSCQQDY